MQATSYEESFVTKSYETGHPLGDETAVKERVTTVQVSELTDQLVVETLETRVGRGQDRSYSLAVTVENWDVLDAVREAVTRRKDTDTGGSERIQFTVEDGHARSENVGAEKAVKSVESVTITVAASGLHFNAATELGLLQCGFLDFYTEEIDHEPQNTDNLDSLVGFVDRACDDLASDGETQTEVRKRADVLGQIRHLCREFPRAARRFQSERHGDKSPIEIETEYDVQYLFDGLLRLRFRDVRAEEWCPSYAGKSPRVDFFLEESGIFLELKLAYDGHGTEEIREELAIDKDHYRSHDGCDRLVCYVYDPENRIENPHGFEKDVAQGEATALPTTVVVSPR